MKVELLIGVTEGGITISFSDLHPPKDLAPIDVTEYGMTMLIGCSRLDIIMMKTNSIDKQDPCALQKYTIQYLMIAYVVTILLGNFLCLIF